MNILIKCPVPCVKCCPGKRLPQPSGRTPARSQTRSKSSGPGPKWCGGQKIYIQPPGRESTRVKRCLIEHVARNMARHHRKVFKYTLTFSGEVESTENQTDLQRLLVPSQHYLRRQEQGKGVLMTCNMSRREKWIKTYHKSDNIISV